jgi:hypothetical protein
MIKPQDVKSNTESRVTYGILLGANLYLIPYTAHETMFGVLFLRGLADTNAGAQRNSFQAGCSTLNTNSWYYVV